MQSIRSTIVRQAIALAAVLLVIKVTVAVLWGYRNYLPPNFESDFLRGRESYFAGGYHWAFYTHITAGPPSLFFGLILMSNGFRLRYPAWHRILGRIQVANVLLLVVPSGLWMAQYAAAGPIGAVGFTALSVLTGTCAAMGWRTAVARRFAEHRRWMWRCFLLLSSAVVIRVMGGLATVLSVESAWYDPLASWGSWLIPLAVYELVRLLPRRSAPVLRHGLAARQVG